MENDLSISLLGVQSSDLVKFLEIFDVVCRDCYRPKRWIVDAIWCELDRRQMDLEEGGLVVVPTANWSSGELVNFARALHAISYSPLGQYTGRFIDLLQTNVLATVFCRLLNAEKEKIECCSR